MLGYDNLECVNKLYVLFRGNFIYNVDEDNLERFKDVDDIDFNRIGNFYCFCGREGCIE